VRECYKSVLFCQTFYPRSHILRENEHSTQLVVYIYNGIIGRRASSLHLHAERRNELLIRTSRNLWCVALSADHKGRRYKLAIE